MASAAERIEHVLEALADAGENRRLAEHHHQIQEVFRLVAFERHHPFLIVQSERGFVQESA